MILNGARSILYIDNCYAIKMKDIETHIMNTFATKTAFHSRHNNINAMDWLILHFQIAVIQIKNCVKSY